MEDAQRRPAIVDPSFELFGCKTPPSGQTCDDLFNHDTDTASPALPTDDWLFQTKRASTLPGNYQFEPCCEVTPKSSVSSTNSSASDAPPPTEYDMGWNTSSTARPRPQSYLPHSASALCSLSMTDLHRGSAYRSKPPTNHISTHQRPKSPPSYDKSQRSQANYRLEASLTRPFSIDDPLELLSEPLRDSHFYNQTSQITTPQDDRRLESIHEHDSTDVSKYRDDLIKRGYRI